MTTLTDIKTRLAELQCTITGVTRAYTDAPSSLPQADFPIFLNFIGPATYAPIAETLAEETRTFIMRLYVRHKGSGIDGEAEAAVTEFLAATRDLFIAHPKLGNGTAGNALDFVERTDWLGDQGIMIMPYAGEEFIGAEFRLNVVIVVPHQIARFE